MLLFLLACGAEPIVKPAPPVQRSVLFLVVDGIRADECTLPETSSLSGLTGPEHMPELWANLGARGVVLPTLQNPAAPWTGPAHALLLTGRASGLMNMPWDPDPGVGTYRPDLPTLFDVLAAPERPARVRSFYTDSLLPLPTYRSIYPGYWEQAQAEPVLLESDAEVVAALRDAIDADEPELLLANLHTVDLEGHDGDLPGYLSAIGHADRLIADLLSWAERQHPEWWEGLLVVVTSDHGRHRSDDPDAWQSHGDACRGCREVPLFLGGGAITTPTISSALHDQLDLSATVAAWLGVELPFREGRPMSALLAVSDRAATGPRDVRLVDGHVAWRELLDDPDRRSVIVVDGERLPSTARYAGPPSLAPGPVLCWRELSLTVGVDNDWVSQCVQSGADGWAALGAPEGVGGELAAPVLLAGELGITAIYVNNPYSEFGPATPLSLSRHDTAGWSTPSSVLAYGPTAPSAVAVGTSVFVAFAASEEVPRPSYTRNVSVWRFTPTGWTALGRPALELTMPADARVERPSLSWSGGELRLAALGIDEEDRAILYTSSNDLGRTWGEVRRAPVTGVPYPLAAPAWDGDWLVWAEAHDDRSTAICRSTLAGDLDGCVDVGGELFDSFAVENGRIVAVVREGGAWTVVESAFGG